MALLISLFLATVITLGIIGALHGLFTLIEKYPGHVLFVFCLFMTGVFITLVAHWLQPLLFEGI